MMNSFDDFFPPMRPFASLSWEWITTYPLTTPEVVKGIAGGQVITADS